MECPGKGRIGEETARARHHVILRDAIECNEGGQILTVIEMLCDQQREQKTLTLLDNCEHLVDTCASSREALGSADAVTINQVERLR